MIPVLLVGFNRPAAMVQTARAVADIGYGEVYVGVDGPRRDSASDAALIEQSVDAAKFALGHRIRGVLRQTSNLGCAAAVPTAIDWFFQHVESGLILEDDCIPTAQAAEFVETGLAQYRASESVYLVSCGSFTAPQGSPAAFLTRFPHLWGWATWRDKWQLLQAQGDVIAGARRSSLWQTFSPLERRDWKNMLSLSTGDSPTTWDYGLLARLWSLEKFGLAPSTPLMRNVGFGPEATHAETPPPWYWEADAHALEEFTTEVQAGPWPKTYSPHFDQRVRREIYSPSITSRAASRLRRAAKRIAAQSAN